MSDAIRLWNFAPADLKECTTICSAKKLLGTYSACHCIHLNKYKRTLLFHGIPFHGNGLPDSCLQQHTSQYLLQCNNIHDRRPQSSGTLSYLITGSCYDIIKCQKPFCNINTFLLHHDIMLKLLLSMDHLKWPHFIHLIIVSHYTLCH